MPSEARSRQRLTVVAALLLGMVLGAAALRLSGMGAPGDEASLAEGTPPSPTQFTISSLNVLGAGHTAPGGNRPGWASGAKRMKWQTELMEEHGVDVIGLQEFQLPQLKKFEELLGATWDSFPKMAWGKQGMRNSVAWRSDQWELVSGSWERIPYFHGNMLRMPVVLLRHLETGQQIYVGSFHNPANARGPAAKWRKQATEIQVAMVNRLRTETGLPVFVTGDMNEKDLYFCRFTAATDMVAANGGHNTGTGGLSGCAPTRPTYVDWIFGSPETRFTSYIANRGPKVRKSTDHPMIIAEAELPPLDRPECPPTPTSTPTPTPTGPATPNVPGSR